MAVLQFKKLEGWLSLPEAGVLFGVTRQDVERKVKEGLFDLDTEVRTIGGGRPIYLVSEVAVLRMVAESGDVTAELLAVV
jgi:hypothetical protein